MKVTEQNELLKDFKNRGTNRESIQARMGERMIRAKAKPKKSKVTQIRGGK